MKKPLSLASVLACFALVSAQAGAETSEEIRKLPVFEYAGQKLDVHEVLSIEEKDPGERGEDGRDGDDYQSPCAVVPTKMIYRDSEGKLHAVIFRRKSIDCMTNN